MTLEEIKAEALRDFADLSEAFDEKCMAYQITFITQLVKKAYAAGVSAGREAAVDDINAELEEATNRIANL